MRLTSIINALFESGGGDIYIGDTRLDGIILDRNNGTLVGTTIESNLDLSGLRISAEKTSIFVGARTRLVATANIEFDSYAWEITSGTATFVGGINTGNTVFIEDVIESNNIVTLVAVSGDTEKRVQIPINFVTGFFSDVKIIGPSIIDSDEPVRFIVNSDVAPESVVWSVDTGGTLSNGSSITEKYVTPDESGSDILLTAVLSKAGYIDKTVTFAIAVDKCVLSGGAALIERPYIVYPRGDMLDAQNTISVGAFVGQFSPSLVHYQIDMIGNSFSTPLIDASVSYATDFSIDTSLLDIQTNYILRVKFQDTEGNVSTWSAASEFVLLEEETKDISLMADPFGDGSCIGHWPLEDSLVGLTDFNVDLVIDSGAVVYMDGRTGRAIQSNGDLKIGLSKTIPASTYYGATVGMWVYFPLNETDAWNTIIRDSANYPIIVDRSNGMKLGRYQSGFHDSGYSVSGLSGWHYISTRYDNSSSDFFIDGEIVGSVPVGELADFVANDGATCICNYGGGEDQSAGSFDSPSIFNRKLSDIEMKSMYLNRPLTISDTLSNYWATNTQNPLDSVGLKNASSYFCEIDNGGSFDNLTRFPNSTSYIFVPGPQDIDFTDFNSPFSISIKFIVDQLIDATIFTVGSSDYGSISIFIRADGKVGYSFSTNGSAWTTLAYSAADTISTGENMLILTRQTGGKYRMFLNGVAVVSSVDAANINLDNSDIKFGVHYSFNSLLFLKNGGIEEVALWNLDLSTQEAVDWTTKLVRPFGAEESLSLPCSAIDKPVILSSEGRRIHITDYYGELEFSRVEYQVFNIFELTYDNPLLQELLPTEGVALIAPLIDSKDYKVRVRYYDIDNNLSQWSRIKPFNVYFIPVSTHDFLLVYNKDYTGFTNVTQHGQPNTDGGFGQFGSADFFSFDRYVFNYGTISFWVKFDDLDSSNGGLHTMIAGGNNTDNLSYIWYNCSNNQFRITGVAEEEILYSNTFTPVVNEWYNIIITMDQFESNIYIDMMDMGTGSSIPFLLDNIGTALLGGEYDFIGGIKGFRIYPEVVTYEDRLDIFQEYD